MRRQATFLLFFIFIIVKCDSQCLLTIKQTGIKADSMPQLFVANYEDSTLTRINDSTLEFTFYSQQPDCLFILIDRKTKWNTRVWMDPKIKNNELIINYNNKIATLKNPSEWDNVSQKTRHLHNEGKENDAGKIVFEYIEKNPNSFLSLWFFTHSHPLSIKKQSEQLVMFNNLSPTLSIYPLYSETKSSLLDRKYPNIGDTFKEFSLTNTNDSTFDSKTIKDKWILLNFWSNGCGPCVKEMDELVNLYNSIDTSKIEFISIALDKENSQWKKAQATNKISWPSVWAKNGFSSELCLYYNVYSMPFFILFNKEKKIIFIKDGANELQNIKQFFAEIK
ncbi:MAG: TlpA family protein disulfide reductase [Bacteroidetes bacterium]|nr:TlpA family protein disulfide reductase [Bacteroidota bacterium]